MNKIAFNLKQHTPIIHFQSGQKGATLRATELKPKIDNFLATDLKDIDTDLFNQYEKLSKDNSTPPNTKPAPLKYKLSVKARDNNSAPIKFGSYINRREQDKLRGDGITPKSGTAYFGDLLAIKNDKITIEVFSFNKKITELIKKSLPYVLAYNNFGTRQSKGFGCYLPEDMTEEEFKNILEKRYDCLVFQAKSENKVFETINTVYQLLKSGLNFPKYKKSKLFEYMCDKNISWEKRKIKQTLKEKRPDIFKKLRYQANRNQIATCDNENGDFRFVRAMLGLAENNEYMTFSRNDKVFITITDPLKDKDPNNPNCVERFRSPITFKVYGNSIFMLIDEIDEKMRGKEFNVNIKFNKETPKLLFPIKTPYKDELDLLDFLSKKIGAAIQFANMR